MRDIADAAGILSGSLYHHFDSKESMVDELLDSFQRSLWEEYDAIEASDRTPREKLEAVVRVSFDAIDQHHSEVAIFQTDAAYLAGFERFAYLKRAQHPVPQPVDRAAHRGGRVRRAARRTSTSSWSTGSCATPSGWRCAGTAPAATSRRPRSPTSTCTSCSTGSHGDRERTPNHLTCLRPTSSTPSAPRSASAAARSRQMHSADLGAHVLKALVERTGIDPGAVDDVVMGCCDTIGSQAGDVARTAWLVAGLPDHVPGVTIDRQCGSSQQAVHFAAQGVMSGTQDLVVAGGLQNMSAIPISAAMLVAQQYGFSTPFAESPGWLERYGDQEVSQFRSAEMIAEKWDISREEMEEFALASHTRALTAIDEGRFENEIVPRRASFAVDECPRDTSLEKMAGAEAAGRGWPDHRRRRLADLRRVLGDADRLRAGGRDARAHPACARAPPLGARATTRSGC